MKIYIAHNFDARIHLRDTIRLFKSLGHEITSTWITDDSHMEGGHSRQHSALVDLQDIDRADALLLFIDQFSESPGRGKYVELGYALGTGKKCFIYGSNWGCIFYHLPQIIHLTSFEEIEHHFARA